MCQNERVTSTLANGFICERYVKAMKEFVELTEECTFYEVKRVNSFCYLGDTLNTHNGSGVAVKERARIR